MEKEVPAVGTQGKRPSPPGMFLFYSHSICPNNLPSNILPVMRFMSNLSQPSSTTATPPSETSCTSATTTNSQVPFTGTSTQLPEVNPETTITLTTPSLNRLSQSITRIKKACHGPLASESHAVSYLLAKGLDPKTFSRVWEDCDLFRGVTATLWKEHRAVLYRIMPNMQHECIPEDFRSALVMNLQQMNLTYLVRDFTMMGSNRIYGDQTAKEPDFSFCPGDVPFGVAPTPSLILEVGVSESYNQLVQDANWWSTSAPTRPGLVVIIHVKRVPSFRVDIEVWTDTQVCNRYDTRNSQPSRLARSQHIYVEGNVVNGGPLRLDFELLMRRPPNAPTEHDVVFTDQQLLLMAQRR